MNSDMKQWLLIAACVIYVISPLDGDFIPGLGWLDDALLIWYTYHKVHQWSEPEQGAATPRVIDHVEHH